MFRWKKNEGSAPRRGQPTPRSTTISTSASSSARIREQASATAAAPASEPAPRSSSESAFVDPFLLDFGTSVNVHDELRHSIRAEIAELDQRLKDGQTAFQQETKQESLLRADLVHAKRELRDICQQSSAALETTNVHKVFTVRFQQSLQDDVLAARNPATLAHDPSPTSRGPAAEQQETMASSPSSRSNDVASTQPFLDDEPCRSNHIKARRNSKAEMRQELDKLKASIITLTEEIQKSRRQDQEMEDGLRGILNRMQQDNLCGTKRDLRTHLTDQVEQIRKEIRRSKASEASMEQAKQRAVACEAELSRLRAHWDEAKDENVRQASKTQAALDEASSRRDASLATEQAGKAGLDQYRSNLRRLLADCDHAEELVMKCKKIGQDFQDRINSTDLLRQEIEAKEAERAVCEKVEEEARTLLRAERQTSECLEEAKQQNDTQAAIVEASKAEMQKHLVREKQLSSAVEEINQATQAQQSDFHARKEQLEREREAVVSSLAQLDREHEAVNRQRQDFAKECDASRQKLDESIADIKRQIQAEDETRQRQQREIQQLESSLNTKQTKAFSDMADATSISIQAIDAEVATAQKMVRFLQKLDAPERGIIEECFKGGKLAVDDLFVLGAEPAK